MTAREHRIHARGLEFAVFEWDGAGPPVFFVHATGFHARCWDQVVARLPGRHCFAIDMRGHGRSSRPAPPYNWNDFGDDVAAVAGALGVNGALGVGHSKGGHAVAAAAARDRALFARLLLIDPVIMPRERYARLEGAPEHFAARRRNEWTSPTEMFDRFKDRDPFRTWDANVLRDYCEFGLLPSPSGNGYELACPPAIEAAVYSGSMGADIYNEIEAIDIPVRLVRARAPGAGGAFNMSSSPTAPDLASHFRQAEDIFLPEASHFLPMEDPAYIASHVRELVG